MHLIWFGCPLPNTTKYPYVQTVKDFAHINPGRSVYLWYDKNTYLNKSEFSNIKFLDINERGNLLYNNNKGDEEIRIKVLA